MCVPGGGGGGGGIEVGRDGRMSRAMLPLSVL